MVHSLFQSFSPKRTASGLPWRARIHTIEQERNAHAMVQHYGLPDALACVLAGRNIAPENVHDYLHPTLKKLMPDPSHLLGMKEGVERLVRAITAHEKIAVFGDYDVDGATSTALLKNYFSVIGHELMMYIPDRMKEGYGPTIAAFDLLIKQGVKLIITVDCGTVAFEPIAHAKAHGVDVIVIDHHLSLPELPHAVAVINPNRIDQESDCRNCAAVGVVFLVLVALNRALRETAFFSSTRVRGEVGRGGALVQPPPQPSPVSGGGRKEPDLLQWLDLVALGTICDVVPLQGLNRALVSQGLKIFAKRTNSGIAAICDVARLDEAPGTYHAGFVIGPRINAGGRVGESALGSQILTQTDPAICAAIAQKLDGYNAERQAIEASVLEAAMDQAQAQHNNPCIVVASHGWHEGVIGIVAGRLKEQFGRPAAVISLAGGKGKGSARSVTGADFGAAVIGAKQQGLLLAGGGHSMAAGFTIAEDQLDAFTAFLNDRLSRAVADYALARAWTYDALVSVAAITPEWLEAIHQAGPFGMGNPAPRWVIPQARVVRCDRLKEKHIRAIISDVSSKKSLTGMAFNAVGTPLGDWLEQVGAQPLHLAGTVKANRWQGRESLQFMIDDAAKDARG